MGGKSDGEGKRGRARGGRDKEGEDMEERERTWMRGRGHGGEEEDMEEKERTWRSIRTDLNRKLEFQRYK